MFQPEVVDFSMPASGWFQGLAIISIKKHYPGQAKKVMMGLWGMGQLSLTKMFIVVDSDINIHDINEVIWALTTQADPARDTVIINNAPTDTLDPASPLVNLGSKLGIDATTKWRDEGYMREIQLAVVDEKQKSLSTKSGTNISMVLYELVEIITLGRSKASLLDSGNYPVRCQFC